MAAYGASNDGTKMLALACRQEVAHLGVTVGVVHHSWIDTDIVRGSDPAMILLAAAPGSPARPTWGHIADVAAE